MAANQAETEKGNDMEIKMAHAIELRFLPVTNFRPARFVAYWDNWPSEVDKGEKRIRRTFTADQDWREIADQAANQFVNWLNAGMREITEYKGEKVLARITAAEWDNRTYVILVETDHVMQAQSVSD